MKPFATGAFCCYNSAVIHFERKFFPERHYRLRLRWVLWGAIIVLALGFVLFIRFLFR